MSFFTTGVLSASLSPTVVVTPPGNDQDGIMSVIVRARSTALLSTVLVVLTYGDELGAVRSILLPVLPLNTLNQMGALAFPFRLGAVEELKVETLLIGGGSYEILWNYTSI